VTASRPDGFRLRTVLRRPALVIWSMFLFSQPFYVFESGLPQPADLLLLPLIPMVLVGWNLCLRRESVGPLRALLLFTVWVCVVDYGWMLATGEIGLMSKDSFSVILPLYYVFNTFVVFVALVLYERHGKDFVMLTMKVVLFTAVVQVGLSSLHFGSRSIRGTIYFNNPNQLGYYALLSACMIALCQRRLKYSIVAASIGLVACMYLALLSASKAAVAGTVMLFALTIVTNPRIIIAVALATAGMLALGGPVARAVETTQLRLGENRLPQWTFLEQRGYDRIENYSEYLLIGAGEGNTARFSEGTVIGTHEIHSSAATLLFAYGIPGVLMFLLFVFRLVRGASLRLSLILLPPLAYTVAHQGLRFTSLWVLLALFIVVKQIPIGPRRVPAP
jgi:hypothetical protein